MNDSPRYASSLRIALRRFFRWLRHPFTTSFSERRERFNDLLRQASQIQTLDELLRRFPERLCETFTLKSFQIFMLHHDSKDLPQYRLTGSTSGQPSGNAGFAASSVVVARMKRERRPSSFVAASEGGEPEAWQLLATPEEIVLLRALGTQLLFPLAGRTRLAGFVSLARPAGPQFSRRELRFFRDLGPHMGRGLETALLIQDLSEKAVEGERSRRELLLAREVQEHLLPSLPPALAGVELASSYRSASEVGGDYFDAFITEAGDLCIVIADVSGKGVPAALVMAAIRASLHALVLDASLRLDVLVERLNDLLFASSSISRYATLFVASYHPASATLTYCNAGHNPPVLLDGERRLSTLSEGGSVLGLFAAARFEMAVVPFTPGCTLVLYTDGITEAPTADGRTWFEQDLYATLRQSTASGAQALLREIQDALNAVAVCTSPEDDQTLLVLHRPKL